MARKTHVMSDAESPAVGGGQSPGLRVRDLNAAPVRDDAGCVLYWMVATRRPTFNFALDRAADWAVRLQRPLLICEPLRCDYPWASDRFHRFVIEGMRDNRQALADRPAKNSEQSSVHYYPYVEPRVGAGRGLIAALARQAAVVVTDDFPCFFIPRMTQAFAERAPVRVEAVDSNGLLPLRAAERAFPTAHSFRRFLQKTLPDWLTSLPHAQGLARRKLPTATMPWLKEIQARWPAADLEALLQDGGLRHLPLNHEVGPTSISGGAEAGRATLRRFLDRRLARYGEDRNQPDLDGGSGLSPYLHFGHLGPHDVFQQLARREGWTPDRLAAKPTGSRGWYGMSESAESFLDELITWRELGYNMCAHDHRYDSYESLPDWAQRTLAKHAGDRRPTIYTLAQLDKADTYDEIWNAAQRQLVREGRVHNYLRMLWGKKILEWSPSPQEALQRLIELNNKYALDGRNPNSYSGIFWCLGRYDRAWGPERPIFGTVRYMSSENTRRKLQMKEYLQRYGS